MLLHLLQIVWVHPREPAEIGEVWPRQAEQLLQFVVHVGQHTRVVDAKNANRKYAGQRLEQRLILQPRRHGGGSGTQFAQ